ncbi:hypothetical protein E2562_036668 [Oryza meyeriana var. granulata]|nr:hypothetical protein E2562_036668 [Oryza meyeriana var. granulata]KAF0935920.1 hypothetical protein E2562_036668 [Oryza meyeriana var. granulata]KAF0935921.1 hypothetical protein E2562_036668 [Oryza meyeriana var. granulata]KAF0935922.1 hypothetical protein E2562_036668 [Oryza meyeriana var. granulata]KAF0935923.1 hypothetical protein E2562_036668 [Oryza meyeriana var. granulata]
MWMHLEAASRLSLHRYCYWKPLRPIVLFLCFGEGPGNGEYEEPFGIVMCLAGLCLSAALLWLARRLCRWEIQVQAYYFAVGRWLLPEAKLTTVLPVMLKSAVDDKANCTP